MCLDNYVPTDRACQEISRDSSCNASRTVEQPVHTDPSLRRHIEQHYVDTQNIICLSFGHRISPRPGIKERTQLAQSIGAEQRAPGPEGDHQVGHDDVGPLGRHRSHASLESRVRDAVSAPVIQDGKGLEALPSQRMEWVGDGKKSCRGILTVCTPRLSPRGAWRTAWATSRRTSSPGRNSSTSAPCSPPPDRRASCRERVYSSV